MTGERIVWNDLKPKGYRGLRPATTFEVHPPKPTYKTTLLTQLRCLNEQPISDFKMYTYVYTGTRLHVRSRFRSLALQ